MQHRQKNLCLQIVETSSERSLMMMPLRKRSTTGFANYVTQEYFPLPNDKLESNETSIYHG